jgi:hypothetical protein
MREGAKITTTFTISLSYHTRRSLRRRGGRDGGSRGRRGVDHTTPAGRRQAHPPGQGTLRDLRGGRVARLRAHHHIMIEMAATRMTRRVAGGQTRRSMRRQLIVVLLPLGNDRRRHAAYQVAHAIVVGSTSAVGVRPALARRRAQIVRGDGG